MKKSTILESFTATRNLHEEEDLTLDMFSQDPEVDETEPMNVVDGELKDDSDADEQSYVGRYVAMCPVCAEPFFCNTEASIIEGMCHDVCPICQEEVDAQVIGVVNPLEDESESDESASDESESDESGSEPDEDDAEAGDDSEEDLMDEGKTPDENKECPECHKNPCECTEPKVSMEFDEVRMNKIFDEFVKENYSAIESLTVERVVRKPNTLTIEAKIITKSGKSRSCSFVAENFKIGRQMVMEMKCDALKAPSKSIRIEARLKGGCVLPESMTYDYVTNILHEGKVRKAQISGTHKI